MKKIIVTLNRRAAYDFVDEVCNDYDAKVTNKEMAYDGVTIRWTLEGDVDFVVNSRHYWFLYAEDE